MKKKVYQTPTTELFCMDAERVIATSDLTGFPGYPFEDDNTNRYTEPF